MLRFKVDENLPAATAAMLTQAGHDALTVSDQQMGGHPDSVIAGVCRQEARVMITLDLDFADIRAYPPADFTGIIVLRLSRLDKRSVLSVVQRLLPLFDQEPLTGKLWIADEATVRVRG